MESFAIWYDGQENKTAKVNVNIWKSIISNKPYSIDIGLFLYDCRSVNYVEVFIPQKIEESQIIDLGKIMISEDILSRAIFNSKITNGTSRQDHEEYEKNIHIADPENDVLLLSFLNSSKYSFSIQNNSSVLRFQIAEMIDSSAENAYLRFRINNLDSNIISYEEKPKFWFFQSAVTCVETIEFRLNDHRLFDRFIIEKLESHKMFKLEKTHLFIMRNASDELIDEHDLKDTRLLENTIWDKYTAGMTLAEKTVAYHYKNDKLSDDVSFFSRIKYPSIKWQFIIGYILIVICLAITANLITDLLKLIPKGLSLLFTFLHDILNKGGI